MTNLQEKTLEIVGARDKTNPITGLNISRSLNLPAQRTGMQGADMRSIINALRMKGYPICASTRGYYWPRSQQEAKDYAESLQARINVQQRAVKGIMEGLDKAARKPVREMVLDYHLV